MKISLTAARSLAEATDTIVMITTRREINFPSKFYRNNQRLFFNVSFTVKNEEEKSKTVGNFYPPRNEI